MAATKTTRRRRGRTKRAERKPSRNGRKWSADVMRRSNALDLQFGRE